MVGQGVLRECLLASDVERVVTIGRSATGENHEKLHEILHSDFMNFSSIEGSLHDLDACFFCLGMSAAGLSEAEYSKWTYDVTMAAAQTLVKLNPAMTFIYVSGAGTNSSEKGRVMWARIKGKTENALLGLPGDTAATVVSPRNKRPLAVWAPIALFGVASWRSPPM